MIARLGDRVERTAWLAGALLLVGSLALRSATVTAGVAIGVLVAVLNYRYLVRFVHGLIASGAPTLPRARFALYFLKYAVTAAVVYVALKFRVANAVAMLVGASVLLPAVLREAIAPQRTILREEA